MILEPIYPKILSIRTLPNAHEDVLRSYGADPEKHSALGLITCDQDDPTFVALDEATKNANVDVVFARSFYAGSSFSSGRLSGEILGVLAAENSDEIEEGLRAMRRCLEHDACFYNGDSSGSIALFPHIIGSLGTYLSKEAGLEVGDAMAYLVAPPIEATIAFDAALKSADVRLAKLFTPPTETNYAAAWLSGDLADCQVAAEAFARKVVEVGNNPLSY